MLHIRSRILSLFLSLFLLASESPCAQPISALFEVVVRRVERQPRCLAVECPDGFVIAPGSRLLLFAGAQPVAWAYLVEATEGRARFTTLSPEGVPTQIGGLRGWVVEPDLVASLLDRWPVQAALQAEVDSVGPGSRSAWIRAGTNRGVGVGDSWWLRVGGQPAARCDVRFAAAEVSFCAVEPLASDTALKPGTRVALWPGPGERRAGRASSAVAYIEQRGRDMVVWVAALRDVACPPDPHLDFYHDGRYVGHGLVERRDGQFWYARLAPAPAEARGTHVLSQPEAIVARPSSAPTTTRAGGSEPRPTPLAPAGLRVGDEVRIRTQAEIDQRRFVARVFDLTPAGALINAGEADGLAARQQMMAYREGRAVGAVAVRRAQRSYAVVGWVEQTDAGPLELRVGDEVQFGPLPAAAIVVGVIQRVVDQTLFAARPVAAAPPLGTPLAVRACGQTAGVAILLTADATCAGGFALPCSMTRPLAAGMQLVD